MCLSLFKLLYQNTMSWVVYTQQKIFLTVLVAGKIKMPTDLDSDESLLPGSQIVPSCCVLIAHRTAR